MKQITFKVDIKPVGTNQAYRKRGHGFGMYMTEEGKAYKKAVGEAALKAMDEAGLGTFWLEKPVVTLIFVYADLRKHDIDSGIKLTLDSMNEVVWNDDSEIGRLVVRKLYKKKCPAVIVHVAGH